MLFRSDADQLASGPALVAGLLRAVTEAGVGVHLSCATEQLLLDDGRVGAVRSKHGVHRARRGVLIAAGGYLGNPRLVAAHDQLPEYQSYFPPTSSGDAMLLAAGVGGSVRSIRNNVVIMLGFDDPRGTAHLAGAPSTRELTRAHAIVVNQAGARFGNEGSFQKLSPALRTMDWKKRRLANLPCFMIADDHYVAKWGIAAPPGQVADFVISANDVRALAGKAGIDPDGLAATIERFNGFAETGVDEDFGRGPGWAMTPATGTGKNPSLGSIGKAPFHAVRLRPTLGAGSGGIKADTAGRVLDWSDRPIPGLYASGDAILHDEFGAGYQAGVTFTTAFTFAWLAVEDMAG